MKRLSSFLLIMTLLISATAVFAQQGAVIKGNVTDENGDALQGANVIIEGTAIGATRSYGQATDADGNYEFTVPARFANGQEVELKASFVSYKENVATITLRTGTITQNFQMTLDVLNLDEIIVTGVVDATPKKKLAFQVDKIGKDILEHAPAANMGTAIQGKVAGARVKLSSGKPGDGLNILLRGTTSVSESTAPLVIVDGVITGASLRDLDASDIADIQVVKGAAAASLYGSRAANGVIQITTDRGKTLAMNETKITFRNEYGINQLRDTPNPISQHHEFFVEDVGGSLNWTDGAGGIVANTARVLDTSDGKALDDDGNLIGATYQDNEFFTPLFDNIDRFFDPGSYYTNTLSIGQNLGRTNWKASFANHANAGIVTALDGYERRNVRLNLDHNLRDGLDFSMSGYYAQSRRDDPQSEVNPFFGLMFLSPDADLTALNDDGTPFRIQADPNSLEDNPLYGIHNAEEEDKRNRVLGSFSLRYTPISWFNVEGNFSYDRSDRSRTLYTPFGYKRVDVTSLGEYDFDKDVSQAINSSVTANANYSFGDFNTRWKFRYLNEQTKNTTLDVRGDDLTVGNVRDLAVVEGNKTLNSSISEVVSNGFFAITGWDYKDKYIGDFLLRWDGSSLFGPDERWNQYFRASGAYRLSEEPWFDFTDKINEVKIRYSIGTAGTRPRFSAQYETYAVASGTVSKATLGNTTLKPELSTEQEFGLDFALFDKFNMEVTYATTETEDLLLSIPLAGFFGFTNQWQNAGKLDSRTLEATLSYQVYQSRDFSWNSRFLIDRTRQEITEFNRPAFRTAGGTGVNAFYVRDDENYGTMYGKYFMIDKRELPSELQPFSNQFQVNDDGLLVWVGDGQSATDQLWGTSGTITDANGDEHSFDWGYPVELLNEKGNPFTPFGRATPDFSWSFSNDVRWKGVTAFLLFDAQVGGLIYNNTEQWALRELRHSSVDQFGKADGNKKPIQYYSTLYNTNSVASWFADDGTFLKLRELSLRYTFRRNQLISGLGETFGGWMNRVSVGVIGRNLMTWTDYEGFDPETAGGTVFRVDNFNYPQFRTFTGFVEIEF